MLYIYDQFMKTQNFSTPSLKELKPGRNNLNVLPDITIQISQIESHKS